MNKKLTHRQDQQFEEILGQIQTAKQQALQQVNKTLVQLYWDIGNYIAKQVTVANWGKSTVEQLAAFIHKKEPGISGFTASNIWRMKQFYETYQQNEKLASLGREIPWSHNRRIMTIKTLEEREFYLLLCKQKKYSVREFLNSHNKCNTPKSVEGYTRTLLTDEKKAVRRAHRAVADGSLHRYLRHQGKKYRKRYGQNDYRGRIPNRVDIADRPRIVDSRSRIGVVIEGGG